MQIEEKLNQLRVIETLYGWLKENRWPGSLPVKCDHVTQKREECSLFLGRKMPGKGRGARLGGVDLLVCNEKTQSVDLIIEVDPSTNPKKLMGDMLAVMLADNYALSKSYSTDKAYKIEETLFIYATLLPMREKSQKEKQFRIIEEAVRSKMSLAKLGLRDVCLCYGPTEEKVVACCQELIRDTYLRRETSAPEELTIARLGWTPEEAAETRARLASFAEDWNAPGCCL